MTNQHIVVIEDNETTVAPAQYSYVKLHTDNLFEGGLEINLNDLINCYLKTHNLTLEQQQLDSKVFEVSATTEQIIKHLVGDTK